ncbi:MAG: addiction module toxin, HicA family [Ignavibacteria bacterium GWB2_35_6b]|nr:MAG: addiction module toxin, HicA family [Ignavibacteria bacterium GWB2_35_6b]
MKRKELISHIEKHGCTLLREGGKHTVYINPITNKVSTIPRHNEINDFLAKKICKDLDIQFK